MNNRIAQALTKLFDRHRIVFWYDARQELREDFEALALPGIQKLEIINNEYGIKYRILREQPEQKFLLYREGPQPADLDNWLLDVQLAQGEFRTDQVAIWLSELELGLEFADVVQVHAEFFQAVKRKDALAKLLKPDDTAGQIRLKMLAVCANSEPRLDAALENMLQELADGREAKVTLIGRCRLDSYLWEQMTRCYGYRSDEPGIRDFAIELFKSCYAMTAGGDDADSRVKLTGDALVFLKRWKDSRQFEDSFETLSAECAEVLGIEQELAQRDFRELIELDYFRLIDQKIISDLVRAVASRTVTSGEVSLWVRQRRQGHWYGEYRHLYEAVDYAAQFTQAHGEARLAMNSLADGVQRYCRCWYVLDQLYRKFTCHMRQSGQASLMADLTDQIENLYTNNYLLKLGDGFQTFVDAASRWEAFPARRQNEFFEHWVRPFLRKDNKVCVIISDAMRYEIGDELLRLIRQEDRYSAMLEPALAMLPSYTQLGMAALLPNRELAIADDQTGTVLVDGQSSRGTASRIKILGRAISQRATACKAKALMAMKGDDCRALVRDHDVIYIYHNRIDDTGDKRESEERVFEAVEETLQELIRLIKKLTAANVNNLLVTADHGFIYQNRAIDESDFSGADAAGDRILFRDRRFVLGHGLTDVPGLHTFAPERLGLGGEVQVQIPRSINRLRLKGSGSRYVHGGASLQEVVIPVLKINKKRRSDVTVVEMEYPRDYHKTLAEGDDGEIAESDSALAASAEAPGATGPEPKEQHLTFQENRKGISFDALLGPYLGGATAITVTDPYIRLFYQVRNFMEFLETVLKHKAPDEEVAVHLVTIEDEFKGEQQKENFEKIKASASAVGLKFTWEFDGTGTIHARHIVTDHGWKISLDRGLDIFQHYEMNNAFTFANRLQQYRPCKAFEVTFIRNRN